MIFKGVLIARASGRLGDSVWAHNRGGPYVRTMGDPNPNPPSSAQVDMREAYASCIAAWAALSPAQRSRWETFSEDHPESGRAGTIRPPGAFAAFVRHNQLRYYVNAALGTGMSVPITEPPSTPWDLPDTARMHATVSLFADTFSFAFSDGDGWYNDGSDGGLIVWTTHPLPATRHAHKGPLLLNSVVQNWFGQPADLNVPTTLTAGQHLLLRCRSLRPDGRISRPFWIDSTTA